MLGGEKSMFFLQLSAASVQSDQEGLGVVGRHESGPPPLTTCHSFTYSSLSTTLCQEFITFQHKNYQLDKIVCQ